MWICSRRDFANWFLSFAPYIPCWLATSIKGSQRWESQRSHTLIQNSPLECSAVYMYVYMFTYICSPSSLLGCGICSTNGIVVCLDFRHTDMHGILQRLIHFRHHRQVKSGNVLWPQSIRKTEENVDRNMFQVPRERFYNHSNQVDQSRVLQLLFQLAGNNSSNVLLEH